MAHVYGHCDFFKNNYLVQQDQPQDDGRDGQPRQSRPPATWIEVGVEEVEEFIDACLSIEDLIDIHSPFITPPRRDEPLRLRRRQRRGGSTTVRRGSAPRTTWIASSIRPTQLAAEAEARRTSQASASEAVSRASRSATCCCSCWSTRRSRPGSRRAVDHSRRGLLLRPAGPDQDHERRLGQLLALARS